MSLISDFDTPWFNNHENLFKLAEWLRTNRGWAFFKDNALDMLETPWSWEKEWRLASGDVHFVVVPEHADDEFTVDGTSCAWCDAQVGYCSYMVDAYVVDSGIEVQWLNTYRDESTGDLACDDCAGTAANFAETTNLAATQTLTERQHQASEEQLWSSLRQVQS